ncbi:coiled-coil domain-containing protein 137 [Hypomesus transpacificus]|uniref:coiled-coil domain-containing protein 137 n=1 Tax=Hypomesus transpacificus TaxID=137520 RepID=UPI001F088316|nr:coiled-coil domain-containing protein 137 [Hypomesus transpacificus]
MGKRKQTESSETLKRGGKTGQHVSKKPKRDERPKQDEHLQQIPFRLREIMKSKERMKKGKRPKPKPTEKIKKVITPKPKMKAETQVEDIPVPHFRRRKKESEKSYVQRMNSETQHVLFLTKNQVERQPELVEDQEEPEENQKSEKKKEYNKSRLQRLHKKKLDRQEDKLENDKLIDKVRFGEVAMAPPTLSVKPKKAALKGQGINKALLLNSLLGQATSSTVKPSMARQRIVEEERLRVVEAYRYLKKQKLKQQESKAAGLDKLMNL